MVRELFDKSALVFGCGNILFGDDGFGPAVVKYLQENNPLPADVLVMDVGTSIREILFNLVISEKKPEKIIIIDAVEQPDRRPGEVFEIPVTAISPKKTADFSLHQFPTVNMLQELHDHTGVEIHVVVVQIQEIPEEIKPGLSPVVAEAVKDASAQILHILGVDNSKKSAMVIEP